MSIVSGEYRMFKGTLSSFHRLSSEDFNTPVRAELHQGTSCSCVIDPQEMSFFQ